MPMTAIHRTATNVAVRLYVPVPVSAVLRLTAVCPLLPPATRSLLGNTCPGIHWACCGHVKTACTEYETVARESA